MGSKKSSSASTQQTQQTDSRVVGGQGSAQTLGQGASNYQTSSVYDSRSYVTDNSRTSTSNYTDSSTKLNQAFTDSSTTDNSQRTTNTVDASQRFTDNSQVDSSQRYTDNSTVDASQRTNTTTSVDASQRFADYSTVDSSQRTTTSVDASQRDYSQVDSSQRTNTSVDASQRDYSQVDSSVKLEYADSSNYRVDDSRSWDGSTTNNYSVDGGQVAIAQQAAQLLQAVGNSQTEGIGLVTNFGADMVNRMGASMTDLYARSGANVTTSLDHTLQASTDILDAAAGRAADAWSRTMDQSAMVLQGALDSARSTQAGAGAIAAQAMSTYQPAEGKAADTATNIVKYAALAVAAYSLLKKAA